MFVNFNEIFFKINQENSILIVPDLIKDEIVFKKTLEEVKSGKLFSFKILNESEFTELISFKYSNELLLLNLNNNIKYSLTLDLIKYLSDFFK